MENLMGMKELYDVVLKATYPIEIGGKKIEEGEVVLAFDNIQVAGLGEEKRRTSAHGGFDDRDLVFWETLKDMPISFTQGVFSKTHLALLSNSKLLNLEPNNSQILITERENLESNEEGKITLKREPVGKTFVYDKETGEKLEHTLLGSEILIEKPYTDVQIHYQFIYTNGGSVVNIGDKLFKGYLSLQAKTRLKEDENGHTVTGIIEIPKLKLMSDLSIKLGRNATPTTTTFQALAIPVGGRGNNYACKMFILNDDIDAL